MHTYNAQKWIIAVAISLASFSLVFAEETREEVFDEIMAIVQSHPAEISQPDNGLSDLIRYLHRVAVGPVTDSMRDFLEMAAESPHVTQHARWSAINALRLFPPQEELPRVRKLLSDKNVNTTAATLLVEWGYWDEGSPILLEKEAWPFLVDVGPREKIEPILKDAAINGSRTLLGQLSASKALVAYGDSTLQYETARKILRRYLVNNEQPEDTMDLVRTTEVITHLLETSSFPEDVELIEAGLYYSFPNMWTIAARSLGRRARTMKDPLAVAALERAVSNSPYADAIEKARKQLNTVPTELKGAER